MLTRLIASAFVLGYGLMLGGCASPRAMLPPNAKTGLTQISAALRDGRAQMHSAVQALRELDKVGTAIPSAVQKYSTHVKALNQTVETTRRRVASADKPDEFFSHWRADLDRIRDTELRESGEKRYAAARRELERLKGEIARLRDVFQPYHAELKDDDMYLRNDPTRAGVEQVQLKIRKIVRGEGKVFAKADVVQKGIDELLQ